MLIRRRRSRINDPVRLSFWNTTTNDLQSSDNVNSPYVISYWESGSSGKDLSLPDLARAHPRERVHIAVVY